MNINVIFLAVMGYVAVQMIAGIVVSRRVKSEDDYLLAGRRLGLSLGTFTIFATWFGAETCIGSAGRIYQFGLAGGSADPFGYALCLLLLGLIFAVPLWNRKLTTLADLFRSRYSKKVEKFAVFLLFPASVIWAAAQIRAFGQILSVLSQAELSVGIAVATGVVIIYTMLGGLLADAFTDLIQGIALIVGLVVVFVAVIHSAGGPVAAFSMIEPQRWNFITGGDFSLMERLEGWAVPVLGSLVAYELIMRISAMRSPTVARRSSLIAGGLYFSVALLPALIGLIGYRMLPNLQDPEQILPLIAQQHLHSFLYILFSGALVSAILSTVDSCLLSASSLLSHNFIIPLWKGISEKGKVRVARVGVLTLGVVAYFLAINGGAIHTMIEESSGLGSAGILIVVVFGLFTRFGGAKAALAAMGSGTLVYFILGHFYEDFQAPYLASIGTAFCSYVIVAAGEVLWVRIRRPEAVPTPEIA